MSPQGLLALASLVLIGLGSVVIATARSGSHVNGVPVESAGQLEPSAAQTGRMPLSPRRWIGIALLVAGLELRLVGAVLMIVLRAFLALSREPTSLDESAAG
jgi:hypothetical protein